MLAPIAPLAFALSALLAAAPTEAFFILGQKILLTTRLDPIVDPGTISGHVHTIAGGSNFDRTMSFASTQKSKCTTAQVSVDKSNYWIPQLYYYNPTDKTYSLIPATGLNAYYLPRGKNSTDIVHAFPDGLRMISGNPNRRTYDGSASNEAISFVCLDYAGGHQGDPEWDQRNNFFNHNCPNGMRAQVNFPSCWDGVNLDSPDHKSHMAFASGGPNGGGDCPASHPVHLVTLFYEFFFDVYKFPFNPAGQPTWVFANGDTTGYGLHADFINGWPALDANGRNVLQDAIEQCNDNNGVGGVLTNCPPFVPFLDSASANACQPENEQVNEEVGFNGPLKALPGNNPIWIGTGPKPTVEDYEEPETEYTDFKSKIPAGYTSVGCISEPSNGRALNAATFSNNNMTQGACVSWCQDRGFPLAGIEYGRECYCDFAMRNGASNTTLLAADRCGMTCANNQNENCGGSRTLTLFNNPSLYPASAAVTLPTGWTGGNCRSDIPGRALRGYSFAADNMTPALCIKTCGDRGFSIAGAEWSRECFCGNQFETGSQDVSSDDCSMTCSGDSTQMCGAGQRLTYWTRAAAVATPSPATTSPATTSPATTSPTTTSPATTSPATTSPATTSPATTSPATTSPATTSPATTEPATTSPATTSPATTSPATTSPTTTSPAATTTASPSPSPSPSPAYTPPEGYIGCWSEPASGRLFNGTTLHDHVSLTLEACVSGCKARGYAFAGAEWHQECFCGNYLDVSLPLPESRCMRPCRGNAQAICGGDRALSVYETNNGTAIRYGQRPSK